MIFTPTAVDGAFLVDIEPHVDERGFFARTFCVEEFRAAGLDPAVIQCSVSQNRRRGTLRGMHLQDERAPEPKLVRVTRGSVWDVVLDLRPHSPTYLAHEGAELSAANHRSMYVPPGCAHGFLTLEDDAEVSYQIGAAFDPAAQVGVRYDDTAFGIAWPAPVEVISERDASWPLYAKDAVGAHEQGDVP